MAFSFLDVLSAITLFLLIFLAAVLITSKKSTTSSRILGTFLLLNALNLSGGLLFISDVVLQRPWLAFWTNTLPLLFGPLLWIYTNDILYRDFEYDKKIIWHFVPFIISFLLLIIGFHIQPDDRKLEILEMARNSERTSLPVVITTLVFYGHIMIYLGFCWHQILIYRKELYNRYSSMEIYNVRWLMVLLGLFGFVILIALINSLVGFSEQPYIYETSVIGLVIAILFFASSTLYRALTFPHFFKGLPRKAIRYADSTFTPEEIRNVRISLYAAMDEKELFRKAHLSLDDLANHLQTTPRLLSQVLNNELGMTFFEYVNKKRIDLATSMLTDPAKKDKTILEIMYDVGFNSKSSFNTAFKRFTRETPSSYREKMSSTS
ncbi:helix-turn-helix domain-containing protein [Fulvivirga sedimenti]|uniref:Helix-turn-helix transcriptional regulator n=1 Tax=Fulvivirga sedimenti TaxID=2879465 RepID=A0A9X1HYD2_9BACT|nr:helix-turn-helix domain-containing protein [Fulvivirga sedimenti]MCA6078987.1 helix-turn-helix transcriptional regulator [Fulvivirga sedimenti]